MSETCNIHSYHKTTLFFIVGIKIIFNASCKKKPILGQVILLMQT